ncbi:MAG: metallophosphoesterase family protein [Kiritimatiellia bacterium]|jgi:hypothetical protein
MSLFSAPPSVFAVEDEYQICIPAESACTAWVRIGGRVHYDHANGILRSGRPVHIVRVPRAELDAAKAYIVFLRPMIERRPYRSVTGEIESFPCSFTPIPEDQADLRIVNLADAHSLVESPVRAGLAAFDGPPDLLVLNGDIPMDCGVPEHLKVPFVIAGRITKGGAPCAFARGNHDMRGVCAEQFAEITPNRNGLTYYTFRVGPVWGVVLDCGEDKPDDHEEYGHTIACKAFRDEEEAWLQEVADRGAPEDAKVRLVICHIPLCRRSRPPFDSEQDRHARWCRLLAKLNPTLLLTGHAHKCFAEMPGGPHDTHGQPCLHICSSHVKVETEEFTCGAIVVSPSTVRVRYVNEKDEKTEEEVFEI